MAMTTSAETNTLEVADESVAVTREQGVNDEAMPIAKAKAKAKVRKGKGKGKGRGKGKARTKGKAKAKAKGYTKPASLLDDGEDGKDVSIAGTTDAEAPPPKPKAKAKGKQHLQQIVLEMIGDGDIGDAIAQAREQVKGAIATLEEAERQTCTFDQELSSSQKHMEEASLKVEQTQSNESMLLDRMRAAKEALANASEGTIKAKATRVELVQSLKVLEIEADSRKKMLELEEVKKAAKEAAEAAARALEASRKKEREALEASKAALRKQSEREAEALKRLNEAAGLGADKRAEKDQRLKAKEAAKAMASDLVSFEKMRQEREKARQQRLREAAGLGRGRGEKRALALPAPISSPKSADHAEDME